ncbi:class I SAM-dependent methyltransferase [Amycolatopsis sp. NPDC059657]|uniref:class I SAM-dependent methyltransferase n=1 Tax=Amycolatopsis sp. NPDC059657 TaxID=3346899 RepID=UPI00366F1E49
MTRGFYDDLAGTYDLLYADWDASMARQAKALDWFLPAGRVLDCACGIGTQSLGLALKGRDVIGTDLSPVAVARARREAAQRGVRVSFATADMRALPFGDATFEAVVCADNSLPHLTTPEEMSAGLAEMRRVLKPGGGLVISTRPYDGGRPGSQPPSVKHTANGRAITFQLWHWHDDGERYDAEVFQLLPDGETWTVHTRQMTYWAITRDRLTPLVAGAGFADLRWVEPEDSGFFQPLLVAQAV